MRNLMLLEKGLRALFLQNYMAGAPSLVDKLANVESSDSDKEDYGFLGDVPAIREFLDERQISGFTDAKQTIVNRKWEATIGVKRDDISDDKLGGYRRKIAEMAQSARLHPHQLLMEAMIDGTDVAKQKAYDGVALFSAAHPNRGASGAQSNLLGGTGVTVAAFKTDVQTVITQFLGLKNEQGKPFFKAFDTTKITIVSPPAIQWALREALNAAIISNTSNILAGVVGEVETDGHLVDANDWYAFYKGVIVRPFIFQDREPLEFAALEGQTDRGFMREEYLYGTRSRYNVGPGLWQTAMKVTNA